MWLALRSPGVRRVVLERVSNWTELRIGLRFEAADFELRPLAGVLEMRDLSLGVGAEDPFVWAQGLRATWTPSSLVGRSPRLGALEIRSPRIDLAKPLPDLSSLAGADPEEAGGLELAIDHFKVVGGSVTGPVPAAVADRIRSWEMGGITLDGRLEGSHFSGRFGAGADLELAKEGVLEFTLAGEAEGELGGAVRLDSLSIEGSPLTARLSAVYGPGPRELEARFRLEADPGFWLAGQSSPVAKLEGEVDLAVWTGRARLVAADQPAELLSRWIDPELGEALALSSSQIDLEAQIDLVPKESATVRITSSARRQGEPLTRFSARSLFSWREPFRLDVPIEVELLPGERGERRITGRILGEDFRQPDEWRVEDGRIGLEVPAVDSLAASLSRLWPELVPEARVASLPALGELVGEARFSGSLNDPDLAARIDWRPHSGATVRMRALGRPLRRRLTIESEAERLEIGHFLPTLGGRVGWTGWIEGDWRRPRGQLIVEGTGLALGDEIELEAARAGFESDGVGLEWELAAESSSHGRLEGSAKIALEKPVRRASGELNWIPEPGLVGPVGASLEMDEGVLEVALRDPVRVLESSVSARLRLPLASLARVPQLEFLSAIPVARASGSALLDWEISEGDWTGVLPVGWKARLASLQAGSRAHLEIDLERPSRSEGSAEIHGLALKVEDREALAEAPLRVDLREGEVRVAGWRLAGDGLAVEIEGSAHLRDGWRWESGLRGVVRRFQSALRGSVDDSWLSGLPLESLSPGLIQFRASVKGPLDELRGGLSLEAPDLRLRHPALPALELASPEIEVAVAGEEARIEHAALAIGDGRMRMEGRFRLTDPLADGSGEVEIIGALPVLEKIELPLELREGRVVVDSGRLRVDGGEGFLRLVMAVDGSSAPATFEWATPPADWAPVIRLLLEPEELESLFFSSHGQVQFDRRDPSASAAAVLLGDGRITLGGRTTVLETPLELELENRVATIRPLRLTSSGQSFDIKARAELSPDWRMGQSLADLVPHVEVVGAGSLDASLLNPLLAGGRAEGPLDLQLEITGRATHPEGHLRVTGPGSSFLFRSPYLTRISEPDLELSFGDRALRIEHGTLRLNEGLVELGGGLGRGESGLEVGLSDVRYRLDHGLLAVLQGALTLEPAGQGQALITGEVEVVRGVLTRDIDLDLDLLSQLLSPVDLTSVAADPRQNVELDLQVSTVEGVRIRNNLADLMVHWRPIAVTGTLAAPVLEGRIEVDSGGLVYAYGQTFRLDRASLEYFGEEAEEPTMDLEVTSSLQDPSIARLAGRDPLWAGTEEPTTGEDATESVATGLTTYLGERITSRLSEALGGTRISLRPVLIFGEADPGARLTVSRDLSPGLSLAASIDLRNAERQTYLLDLHRFRRLPRFGTQLFTSDLGDESGLTAGVARKVQGATARQTLEFGGSGRSGGDVLPRVRKIRFDRPSGVSRRTMKRAIGLRKGDEIDADRLFAVEVETGEMLLRRGYPDARVRASTRPVSDRPGRVDLHLEIVPGTRVAFLFAGDLPPKSLRQSVTSLYRTDFYESASLEEMRDQTVRVFRSQGFLDPEVTVEVGQGEDPSRFDRQVLIRTTAGVSIAPGPPLFEGLPEEETELVLSRFPSVVQRVELAMGVPRADERVLEAVRLLGYIEPRITRRWTGLEEGELHVEVAPGERWLVGSRTIEGDELLAQEDREQLRSLVRESPIRPEQPLRGDRLAELAVALERELQARGYAEAKVQVFVADSAPAQPLAKEIVFSLEPGELHTLGEVRFAGLRSTRPSWAEKVAGLEEGQTFAPLVLPAVEDSLFSTGLFSRVDSDWVEEGGRTRLVFDLQEYPRFQLAYGLRWDSEDGGSAVADLTDRNFLGRSVTLGLRALYSDDDRSLRGLVSIPRPFGARGSLELFVLARDTSDSETGSIMGTPFEIVSAEEILEGTIQYSRPIGRFTTARVYGRYKDTRVTEELLNPLFPIVVDEETKSPALGFQWIYDSRSDELLPSRGMFSSVDLSGSDDFLGSDLSYARIFGQFNLFQPIGRLAGRPVFWTSSYRLGFAEPFQGDLKRESRFFAGGEYSVRGYGTESLGPQEELGFLVRPAGGSALLVINQELRLELLDRLTGLVFLDAGNVWPETSDFGSNLLKSVGVGLRALTPVGLLRLDLAHSLDGREFDPDFKLYFGFGSTF
jgi:outer membrane protein assembly factor BamA